MNKKKENKFFRTVKNAVAHAAIAKISGYLIDYAIGIADSKFIYHVDLQHTDTEGAIAEVFGKGLGYTVRAGSGEPEYLTHDFIEFVPIRYDNTSRYINFTKYNGSIIGVYIDKATSTNDGNIAHLKRNELFCLNTKTDIANLKAFTKKVFEVRNRQNRDERIDNLSTVIYRGKFNNNIWLNSKLRTFDDVFIPSADKEKIMNHVNAFIDKRDWYIKNNIPHHLGIMLYGEPGTGKSSIAQAIVDSIDNVSDFIIVEGNEIKYIDYIFDNLINQHAYDASLYRVVLFEDVDTGLSDINRDKSDPLTPKTDKSESKETDLAGILNFLDGIRSPTNCIFIFTTNHIENIDQAILRPGRCDVSVEIKNVCVETLLEFLKFHFPEENITLPKTYKVKDGITFAELQNHIAIGETSDDIIKFCKRGKSE